MSKESSKISQDGETVSRGGSPNNVAGVTEQTGLKTNNSDSICQWYGDGPCPECGGQSRKVTQTDSRLALVTARWRQNARGYRMGWSEAQGKFGLLGDRASGGLVPSEKYEQVISALLCCTEDIPWLIKELGHAQTLLEDRTDSRDSWKKMAESLSPTVSHVHAPSCEQGLCEEARAISHVTDLIETARNVLAIAFSGGESPQFYVKDAIRILEQALSRSPAVTDVVAEIVDFLENAPTNLHHGTGWAALVKDRFGGKAIRPDTKRRNSDE